MHPVWYCTVTFGLLLQGLLFWRAFRCRLWRNYPAFYGYLAYTTVWSVVFSILTITRYPAYSKAYWLTYLFAAILRFGIAAEVHRYVFPRTSALRRRVNLFVLFALLCVALVFWTSNVSPGASVLFDSLRKIALAVAIWLSLVLGLASFYRIHIGRNAWGMALGLLTFTGSELAYLSGMDLLPGLSTICGYVHPFAFLSMLLVWTYALWSYAPNPRTLPDDSVASEFLSAWQDRWTEIPEALRRVVKS